MTRREAETLPQRIHLVVHPGTLTGSSLSVPGDKSIAQRALILSAIAEGESVIRGVPSGADCASCAAVLRELGVRIDNSGEGRIVVYGSGMNSLSPASSALDCGNSGTCMRLLTGLLSAQSFDAKVVGDESLMRRPMQRVADPLVEMGASISTDGGHAPINVSGGRSLAAIDYQLPVPSAQVKSAILLAGLYANGVTSIHEPDVTRDHTEKLLEVFGCPVSVRSGAVSVSGPAQLRSHEIDIVGDFSAAAFFVVAGTISGKDDLSIPNVGINPTRTGLLDVLKQMGAKIAVTPGRSSGGEPVGELRISPAQLNGVDVPAGIVSRAVDEFPVLFVAAAVANGTSRFSGLAELRHKESDRVATMATALRALGVDISTKDDSVVIKGGCIGGGTVDCAGDHRAGMALAIAGLVADNPVSVAGAEAIDVSYPGFIGACRDLGMNAKMAETNSG